MRYLKVRDNLVKCNVLCIFFPLHVLQHEIDDPTSLLLIKLNEHSLSRIIYNGTWNKFWSRLRTRHDTLYPQPNYFNAFLLSGSSVLF